MEVEEDFRMEEEDHQEEDNQGATTTTTTITMEDEDQINWWETLQKYSEEYERKLSLSLLFGGYM